MRTDKTFRTKFASASAPATSPTESMNHQFRNLKRTSQSCFHKSIHAFGGVARRKILLAGERFSFGPAYRAGCLPLHLLFARYFVARAVLLWDKSTVACRWRQRSFPFCDRAVRCHTLGAPLPFQKDSALDLLGNPVLNLLN